MASEWRQRYRDLVLGRLDRFEELPARELGRGLTEAAGGRFPGRPPATVRP